MDTACGGVGQRVGNAASVADDVETFVAGFQFFVYVYFHVIELHFHTIVIDLANYGTV